MENNLISIIIPVYNVEKYLNDCIESVVNQTYSNLEIILVDDGSPDNSPKICDDWSLKDSRIKVIHKSNGGLSDARNAGLDICSGEYIAFIDSDDYIDEDYIKLMYDFAKDNSLELVQCGVKLVTEDKGLIESIGYDKNCILSYKEHNLAMYDAHPSDNVISCNKLYHKKLFDNCRFPFGILNEDEATVYKCVFDAKQVGVLKNRMYNYVQHQNSIVNSVFNVKKLVITDILKERARFFEEQNEPELAYAAQKHYINLMMATYAKTYYYIDNNKDILHKIKNDFKKELDVFNSKSFKMKLKCLFFYISPSIFSILMKINKKI